MFMFALIVLQFAFSLLALLPSHEATPQTPAVAPSSTTIANDNLSPRESNAQDEAAQNMLAKYEATSETDTSEDDLFFTLGDLPGESPAKTCGIVREYADADWFHGLKDTAASQDVIIDDILTYTQSEDAATEYISEICQFDDGTVVLLAPRNTEMPVIYQYSIETNTFERAKAIDNGYPSFLSSPFRFATVDGSTLHLEDFNGDGYFFFEYRVDENVIEFTKRQNINSIVDPYPTDVIEYPVDETQTGDALSQEEILIIAKNSIDEDGYDATQYQQPEILTRENHELTYDIYSQSINQLDDPLLVGFAPKRDIVAPLLLVVINADTGEVYGTITND